MDPVEKIRNIYKRYYKNIEPILNGLSLSVIDVCSISPTTSIEKVTDLRKEYDFPLEIEFVLSFPQKSNQSASYKSNIRFLSIDSILDNVTYIKSKYGSNVRFIDIGETYHGMGHWVALSWDKILKKFFFRLVGGSDGYSREAREKFYYTKFNPRDDKYMTQALDLKDVMEMIINNDICDSDKLIWY